MRPLHVALISLSLTQSLSWSDQGGHKQDEQSVGFIGRFLETSGSSKSVSKAGNSQGKTEGEAESESESKSESKSESESKDETESKGQTESQGMSQSKTESQGEIGSQGKTESNGKTESKSETQAKSKGQTEPQGEDESQGTTEATGETRSKGEDESKGDDKSEDESESKVDGGSEDNFTMPDLYDSNGWHYKKDWASKIIEPQTLQPYYMMPLFFGVKTMFTLLVFQFSLSFTPKSPSDTCLAKMTDAAKLVAKNLSSLAFIILALNGYYCDFDEYNRHAQHCTNRWQQFGVFVMVALTSPNYVAAVAIWTSLKVESPMTLLAVKQTRYPAIHTGLGQFGLNGIPLLPGSTKWLPCMKHLYAIVLWPYFVPTFIASCGYLFACCTIRGPCVLCSTIVWGTTKSAFALSCAMYTTIFTIGLWKWPRDTFIYQFWLYFPVLQMCFLQIWAMVVVPFIMSFIFTILLRFKDRFSVFEAFGKASNSLGKRMAFNFMQHIGMTPQPKSFNPEDVAEHEQLFLQKMQAIEMTDEERAKLIAMNADLLRHDFEDDLGNYSQVPTSEAPGNQASEAHPGLEATKIAIFGSIIADMATIVVQQAGAIFAIRGVLGASTYEEFVSAAAVTLHERHAQAYFHHVAHLAELSRYHAANAIWTLL